MCEVGVVDMRTCVIMGCLLREGGMGRENLCDGGLGRKN